MKTMGKSKIRYAKDKVPSYYGWNPGGFGCSARCDGCWSEGMSRRLGKDACPQCRTFVPHLHPERLPQPGNTKKPGVVLVNFTCDTFDNARRVAGDGITELAHSDVAMMLSAARDAPHHTYVWLTKQPQNVAPFNMGAASFRECANWYLGLSICNQEQADAKLPTFLKTPGKLWLSLEPLWGPVDLDCVYSIGECDDDGHPLSNLSGVIVGHDNRRGAPGTDTLDHVRSVVQQCEAAGVSVFVKQLHLDGKLRYDPADFPEDLRHRDLPWRMPI